MTARLVAWVRGLGARFIERQIARGVRMSMIEIPRDRDAGHACLALAVATFEAGDRGGAETHVRVSLEHDLSNADAHLFLARLLRARGERTQAASALEQAALLSSRPADLWAELGELLHGLGERERAISVLNRSLELDPTQAEPAVRLGHVYLDGDEVSAARQCFEYALRMDGSHIDARCQLDRIRERDAP